MSGFINAFSSRYSVFLQWFLSICIDFYKVFWVSNPITSWWLWKGFFKHKPLFWQQVFFGMSAQVFMDFYERLYLEWLHRGRTTSILESLDNLYPTNFAKPKNQPIMRNIFWGWGILQTITNMKGWFLFPWHFTMRDYHERLPWVSSPWAEHHWKTTESFAEICCSKFGIGKTQHAKILHISRLSGSPCMTKNGQTWQDWYVIGFASMI